MSTIKTIDVGGVKRVLLKTINGVKRVSCSCCGDFIFDIQARSKYESLNHCGVFANVDPFLELLPPELQANDGKIYKNIFGEYEDPWVEGNTLTVRNIFSIDPITFICTDLSTTVGLIYNVDPEQPPYDDGSTFNYIKSINFSEEDTPQDLKDRLDSLIESMEFTEWENSIGAPRSLGFYQVNPPLGGGGLVEESQMRVKHSRTSTGYLKMWFLKRNYVQNVLGIDEEGEIWVNPTDEDFETYEWTGDPLNSELPITDPENTIIGEPIDIPYEYGIRNDIYPFKWSFVESYEPSDPTNVEPFPTTTRPIPDCESNGFRTFSEECPPQP
jgi:hypothetical protein